MKGSVSLVTLIISIATSSVVAAALTGVIQARIETRRRDAATADRQREEKKLVYQRCIVATNEYRNALYDVAHSYPVIDMFHEMLVIVPPKIGQLMTDVLQVIVTWNTAAVDAIKAVGSAVEKMEAAETVRNQSVDPIQNAIYSLVWAMRDDLLE